MAQDAQLLQIQREIVNRFAPHNTLTRAIARKLARSLYELQRNESLLGFARSLSQTDLGRLTKEERTRVKAKIREVAARVEQLHDQCLQYADALSAGAEAGQ